MLVSWKRTSKVFESFLSAYLSVCSYRWNKSYRNSFEIVKSKSIKYKKITPPPPIPSLPTHLELPLFSVEGSHFRKGENFEIVQIKKAKYFGNKLEVFNSLNQHFSVVQCYTKYHYRGRFIKFCVYFPFWKEVCN